MATEKTINTRIQLKYSSLEEWSDLSVAGKGGNLVLKAGEVGICAVPRGDSHLQTTPPAIMFKVGDGTTAFKDLPWASGLAADVYPWAKAKDPPAIGNGKIIINQAGVKKGEFTVNQTGDTTIELTDNNSDTNTQYKLELEGHKLILKSKEIGETTWNTVASTITLPDNDTTYTFATGDEDGTFKVTPSSGSAQNVKIKNVMVSTGGAFTGAVTVQAPTADMNPATKQYVDSAIEGVSQFNYKVVTTLPTASADTMGTIYLVKHTHNTNPEVTVGTNDTYDEYLTIQKGSEYSWEKIGNTDIDLSGYYNSLLQTGSGVVTDVSEGASGQIMVTRTSLTAADPTAGGTATDFIATVSQAANGKITATKKSVATMTGATLSAAGAKGLVPAPASGDQTKFLRGDGTWAAVDKANQLAFSRSIDGVEFNGSESITHYGECDTAAATAEKTVICSWFQPVTGARIAVKFTNSNSASNPTLNVHGTGAKPIYYRGSAILASYLAANRTYEFIYNGTQYDLVGDINIDTNTAHGHSVGVGLVKEGNGGISGSVNYKVALASETRDTNAAVSRPAANANRTYPVIADKNGNLATIVPWTDTDTNTHYESKNVIAGSATGNANSGDSLANGSVYLNHVENGSITSSHPIIGTGATTVQYAMPGGQIVINSTDTGVTSVEVTGGGNAVTSATISGRKLTLKKDTTFLTSHQDISGKQDKLTAGSHITISNNTISAAWPTSSDTGYAGINKVGTVTSVGISTTTNGGLKVTNSPVTSSGTINIDIDDSVVFVLNCGSATVNV